MTYRDGFPLWLKVYYIIVLIILLITLFMGIISEVEDNKTALKFPNGYEVWE